MACFRGVRARVANSPWHVWYTQALPFQQHHSVDIPSLALFFPIIKSPNFYIELPCGRHCPNTFAYVILINRSLKHYLRFTDGELRGLLRN